MHRTRRARERWGIALVLASMLSLAASTREGHAHFAVARASLRQYLDYSQAVVRARVLDPRQTRVFAEAGRQDVQRIRVEEILALRESSERPPLGVGDEIALFFHAEGSPAYRPGDRALVFLEVSSRSAEMAGLAPDLPWYSMQGPGDEWKLDSGEGDRILGQARGWLDWLSRPDAEADATTLRALLIGGLRSGVGRLEEDSIAELIRLSSASGLHEAPGAPDTIDALAESVGDRSLPLAHRVALLRAIQRGLGPRVGVLWSQLVASAASPREAAALAGLLGPVRDPAVSDWLRRQSEHPDLDVRRAAWRAISQSASAPDLEALTAASADPDPVIARAAIRGLERLENPAALRRLADLSGGSDGERSRWAAAALRRSAQRR